MVEIPNTLFFANDIQQLIHAHGTPLHTTPCTPYYNMTPLISSVQIQSDRRMHIGGYSNTHNPRFNTIFTNLWGEGWGALESETVKPYRRSVHGQDCHNNKQPKNIQDAGSGMTR